MYRYFLSIMLALSSMVAFSISRIEFVDLGLPSGNLWAKENLGSASTSYYAWGEIKANKNKEVTKWADAYFSWETYFDEKKALPESQKHIYLLDPNKTNNNVIFSGFSSVDCGTLKDPLFCVVPVTVGSYTHGGRSLPAAYDAATKALGKDYIIPSQKDFQELFTYTTRSISRSRSNNIITFTSKINGKSISFPLTGMKEFPSCLEENNSGYYWTSDPDKSNPSKAVCIKLTKTGNSSYSTTRYKGLPIRPIKRNVSYTEEDFYIGLGEPSYQVLNQHPTLEYADNKYVSDMAGAFGVSTFRVWMSVNSLFTIREDGVVEKKLDEAGETAWNSLKDFVKKLKKDNDINRICFLPNGYVVDESYPNFFCWNKSESKLAWYSATEYRRREKSGQKIKSLSWAYSCSPNPNTEPDAYLRFLKNQEKVFKILADSFPDVEFFEASNEPEFGVNLGDKWQVLRSLKPGTADFNSMADTIVKYSVGINKRTAQSLLRSRINEAKTAKYPNELLYKIQTDLCFYISKALKESARLSGKPKKLLSPAFTTTGESFDFLKGMYDKIAIGQPTGVSSREANPNHYFQILNIHPYLFHSVLPDTSCGCKIYDDWRSHVEEIYKITIDNGHRTSEGKTIPVWFTEFGFTDEADSTYKSWKRYTQDNQQTNADYLYYCLEQAKDMGFVNTVVVFRMNDFKYTEINTYNTVEGNYGMIEYLKFNSEPIELDSVKIDRLTHESLKPIGIELCADIAMFDTKAKENKKKGKQLYNAVKQKLREYIKTINNITEKKPHAAPKPSMPTDVDDEISVTNDIAVYPNPTSGLLYVACGDGQTIKNLSLMDANGKVLMVKEVDEDVSVLDLSLWEKNLYFVKITTNENTVVEKILLK